MIFQIIFLQMLQKFLATVFDEEHEFQDLWELKLVKFDIDLDDSHKSYEKYLTVSSMVQDLKGNPKVKGDFFLTNLRLIWHVHNDKSLNLSIGLDTINNVIIKSMPAQQGLNDLKYIMTVKSLSPSQTKYQFKFVGYTQAQEKIFKKVENLVKKYTSSKLLRTIDIGVKLSNNEYVPLQNEEMKTRYEKCVFLQNRAVREAIVILTNIRLVIVHDKIGTNNYGIPWIMIEKFVVTEYNNKPALQLKIRGIFKNIDFYVCCLNKGDFNKMHHQVVSFSQTYNKDPTLGLDFSSIYEQNGEKRQLKMNRNEEFNEIEQTKVNIGRRKNAYGDQNQKGSLKQAFFNEQLGIMMQRLPQGYSRADYWQILRN